MEDRRPNQLFKNLAAKIAAIPLVFTAVFVFLGGSIWTVVYSFTSSRAMVSNDFVGFDQYVRLFNTPRWSLAVENIIFYAFFSLLFSFVFGFILAALMDQKIRFENAFRTIYLYPFALSFIVTGVAWQWILNPTFGIQQVVRGFGWESFNFDLIARPETVMWAVLIAGLWQGTGLVMILLLAGLRTIDEDIWKASRVDGIPKWRTYVFIIIPMMRPILITTLVITAAGIVRLYDLVVALTKGGPGNYSDVPAKYVFDHMFARANVGQGLAASTIMLLTVLIILVPWMYYEYGSRSRRAR